MEIRPMKKALSAALLLAALSLAACNTVHGMGQDLSAAGRAIQGSTE
jgi:predicted small secreted protein